MAKSKPIEFLNGAYRYAGHLAMGVALGTAALSAQAAEVDLVTSLEVSMTTSLAPFDFVVHLGNNTGTAGNAVVNVVLPANLSSVSVVSVSSLAGASCPAPAGFSGVPADRTVGGEVVTASIPVLPAGGACRVTINATPVVEGGYRFTSEIAPGAPDVERNPATNVSHNNSSIVAPATDLRVSKTITAGAVLDVAAGYPLWHANGYDTPVEYTLTFENHSALDLPLGDLGDAWEDWESKSSQEVPASSATSLVSCTLGAVGAPSGVDCSSRISIYDQPMGFQEGTGVYPFTFDLDGFVLPAGEAVTVVYTRTYAAPYCGNPEVWNAVQWHTQEGSLRSNWLPNYQSGGASGSSSDDVWLRFPTANGRDCIPVNIDISTSKDLVSVVDASGTAKATAQIDQDGDAALYDIVIAVADFTAADDWLKYVPVNVWDQLRTTAEVTPVVTPGTLTQTVEWVSCSATGGNSDCQAPSVVHDGVGNLNLGQNAWVTVYAGETLTLRLKVTFNFSEPLVCVSEQVEQVNYVEAKVEKPWVEGYLFSPYWAGANTETTPVPVLPAIPRCVELVVNKSASTEEVTSPTSPLTLTLQFANMTANPRTAGPLSNVQIVDVLGPRFNAVSASCHVVQGDVTVPAGSLLGSITGPDNTLSLVIPAVARGGVGECRISGYVAEEGTYTTTAQLTLPAGSQIQTGVDANGNPVLAEALDPNAINHEAKINYQATWRATAVGDPTPVPVNHRVLLLLLSMALMLAYAVHARRS